VLVRDLAVIVVDGPFRGIIVDNVTIATIAKNNNVVIKFPDVAIVEMVEKYSVLV